MGPKYSGTRCGEWGKRRRENLLQWWIIPLLWRQFSRTHFVFSQNDHWIIRILRHALDNHRKQRRISKRELRQLARPLAFLTQRSVGCIFLPSRLLELHEVKYRVNGLEVWTWRMVQYWLAHRLGKSTRVHLCWRPNRNRHRQTRKVTRSHTALL